jgi:hypothetical protein
MIDRLVTFSGKYPLDTVSYVVILIPFTIGLFFYAHLRKEERILLVYFLFTFLKETAALIIMLAGHTNLYLQNVQTFIDIFFFGFAYWYGLHSDRLKRYIMLTGGFCLFMAATSFDTQSISPLNQIAAKLFAVVAVLLFFTDILAELRIAHLSRHGMFWLSAGLLLFAAGTFLIALFSSILISAVISEDTFDLFWNIQQVLLTIFCLLASVGFWVSGLESRRTAL